MRNWGGNHTYAARQVHRPQSFDELRAVVSTAGKLRVLGSRHSFTDVADADELVTLEALPAVLEVAADRRSVTVGGATRYGDLARELNAHGLALANLASLPHISIAGAVATATHGAGDRQRNLAGAVAALELLTAEGDTVVVRRGDAGFEGHVVSLGALGVITRVTLDVEPYYEMTQRVFERLAWEHVDDVFAAGDSVSVFTRWGAATEHVWVKRRVDDPRDDLLGAPAATQEHHPIPGADPIHCTPQLGLPGPWSDRLPHFRMGFRPSSGEEIQSEYFVARTDAVPAIEALRPLGAVIEPVLQISEMRTVAADELWLSPQYRRDSIAFHFTWRPDQPAVERVLADVERALAPFAPRPHWGKLFLAAPPYERTPDFLALMERLDPRGVFSNGWIARHVVRRRT